MLPLQVIKNVEVALGSAWRWKTIEEHKLLEQTVSRSIKCEDAAGEGSRASGTHVIGNLRKGDSSLYSRRTQQH